MPSAVRPVIINKSSRPELSEEDRKEIVAFIFSDNKSVEEHKKFIEKRKRAAEEAGMTSPDDIYKNILSEYTAGFVGAFEEGAIGYTTLKNKSLGQLCDMLSNAETTLSVLNKLAIINEIQSRKTFDELTIGQKKIVTDSEIDVFVAVVEKIVIIGPLVRFASGPVKVAKNLLFDAAGELDKIVDELKNMRDSNNYSNWDKVHDKLKGLFDSMKKESEDSRNREEGPEQKKSRYK